MGGVDVRSIDALDELSAELARFAAEAQEAMLALDVEVARTLDMLQRERRRCEEEVRRREADHMRAQARLQTCIQTPPDRDGRRPDCSRLAEEARITGMALRAAQEELRAVLARIRLVQEANDAYRQQAGRLGKTLGSDLPAARAYLGRQASTLRSYVAMGTPSGTSAGALLGAVAGGVANIAMQAIAGSGQGTSPGADPQAPQQPAQRDVVDTHFTDKAGRPITIRCWEGNTFTFVQAFDTSTTPVPDTTSTRAVSRASLMLEQPPNSDTPRVKLQDIETIPSYREAGIASQMLGQIEAYGQRQQAAEIYGVIENAEARAFWEHQAARGWHITPGGAYGEVHKTL
jgi:GNAT superfamily N-acetyltransferase